MKKLVAIILGIALIFPAPAQADVSKYVHFYPPLESYTLSAPVVDSVNNNYIFPVTIWNHLKSVDQVHFKLYDCNNLGQDTEWVVFNYKDNYGIPARGKDWYIGDIILNYSAWTKSGVGLCSGNWKLVVVVVLTNGTNLISSSELKVLNNSIGTLNPANGGWIQNHINEIQKITDAWNAATKALEENQRLQAEAKAKAEAEARAKAEAERILKNSQDFAKKTFTGKSCNKINKKMTISEITFTCVKKGKRLSWQWK